MDRVYYGQVKWFKDSYGYGFITVQGQVGEADWPPDVAPGKQVFVHHTDVRPTTSTYKTLCGGEYVSFGLKVSTRPRGNADQGVELQACEVRGAYGGPLMCDVANVSGVARGSDAGPVVLHNGDIMFGCGEDIIL